MPTNPLGAVGMLGAWGKFQFWYSENNTCKKETLYYIVKSNSDEKMLHNSLIFWKGNLLSPLLNPSIIVRKHDHKNKIFTKHIT